MKYLRPSRLSLGRGAGVVALGAVLCPCAGAQQVQPIVPSGVASVGMIAPSSSGTVAPVGVGEPVKQATVQSAGLRSAAVGALIERFRARTLSPEEAWKSGALNVDDLLYIVEERVDAWGGFNWQKDNDLRRALVKLLIENGGEKLKDTTKLSHKVRLWLADYYGSVGDKQVVELAESILRELKPKVKGQEDLAFQAVERIAWFYRDKGEHEKNARTWQRLESFLSEPGWWLPDAMIEEARSYEQAGQDDLSRNVYLRVIEGDNDDFAGGALWEYGHHLIRRGELDKARQLLLQVQAKPSGTKKRILAASMLGSLYYLKGEWKESRQSYEKTLTQSAKIVEPEQRRGLESVERNARQMLRLIGQWETRPLVSDPARIEIKVGRETPEAPITRRFLVSMFREVPLTVSSTNPQLQLRVEESPWAADAAPLRFEKQVVVSIPPALLQKDLDAEIVIGSPQLAPFQLRVPLKITKAHE